tara:strand:- start:3414 stop:4082 length:669 start_codon:yes stop_codon:yes gene_type:complete
MTIEELNKIIQEELKAYLNEEQTDEAYHEDGDDDIEVTTDEPDVADGGEAMDTLKQIYNMLKPMVEPEEEEEPEMDMEEPVEDEGEGEEEEMDEAAIMPNYRADYVSKVKADAEDVNKGLNESTLRMQKLAGLITESELKEKLSLNENVAEKLIKVYKGEIRSAKASDELDIIPALEKGITRLEKGEDPKKVNTSVAREVAKIQGEFDSDEFARIYMDKAKK